MTSMSNTSMAAMKITNPTKNIDSVKTCSIFLYP
ncbi:Uncharacterised protein [Segatella copri]|nr:Uncharacterised protein [Segatella copri]